MSKKCCKSYKEGKACKKCPRFRDWNYLVSWKPAQLRKPGERQNVLRIPFLFAQVSRENHAVGAGSSASTRTCHTAELWIE